MREISGITASPGIAMGPIRIYADKPFFDRDRSFYIQLSDRSPKEEVARFHDAAASYGEELRQIYEKALSAVGRSGAAIFDVYRMLLEDHNYIADIEDAIRIKGVTAEAGVFLATDKLISRFFAIEHDYLNARADDLLDISDRLVCILLGQRRTVPDISVPSILTTDTLSPSDLILTERSALLGILTAHGSYNSHTAILARMLHIPFLTGISVDLVSDNATAILDGHKAVLITDPDASLLSSYQKDMEKENASQEQTEDLRMEKTVTFEGIPFRLQASVARTEELDEILGVNADGIGVFRSESLCLSPSVLPSEEELLSAYRFVTEKMGEKPAIFRLTITETALQKTQLRAILQASATGNTSVLCPGILSVSEANACKKMIAAVKNELLSEHIAFRIDLPFGIVIDTPAAAILSAELAKEADFFSIDTDDLIRFTLATDRKGVHMKDTDIRHPAVLRLIEMTVINAHRENIPVGIFGRLASDPSLTAVFLRMGIDELSVLPSEILPIRKTIRQTRTI
ncbi:MAG: hypothetical protein K6G07_00555 [Lachnospiraceae bacterium]|nr:hypothetical protein [Lachnospiraceae bacterium]